MHTFPDDFVSVFVLFPVYQDGDGRMRKNFGGDAADDQGADTAAAVRSHDDQIGADILRFSDDLKVNLVSAGLIGHTANAGRFGPGPSGAKRLGSMHFGKRLILRPGVAELLRIQRNEVKGLRHDKDGDFRAHFLCERDGGIHGQRRER